MMYKKDLFRERIEFSDVWETVRMNGRYTQGFYVEFEKKKLTGKKRTIHYINHPTT